MGDFRMTLEGIGGHGCDRNAKAGGEIQGCGKMGCPDCQFAEFVTKMKKTNQVLKATMHHWPANMTDHILSRDEVCIRCGAQDKPYADGRLSLRKLSEPCRDYSEKQEVIDDLSEREVRYPGLIMAVGKRVKGSF
jgi:hypothetical protein